MRRSSCSVVAVIAALFACSNARDCPEGTTARTLEDPRGKGAMRTCVLEDGVTVHGPVVQIDEHGRERIAGNVVRGRNEGRFVFYDYHVQTRTDIMYKAGQPDGRATMHVAGQLRFERHYDRGRLHGKATFFDAGGKVTRVEHYEHNKPSGTWESFDDHGGVESRQQYGVDGVLLAIDGNPVRPPRARFELPDGSVVERSLCVEIAEQMDFEQERRGVTGCLDLFEEDQKCSDDACRAAILEEVARRKPDLQSPR